MLGKATGRETLSGPFSSLKIAVPLHLSLLRGKSICPVYLCCCCFTLALASQIIFPQWSKSPLELSSTIFKSCEPPVGAPSILTSKLVQQHHTGSAPLSAFHRPWTVLKTAKWNKTRAHMGLLHAETSLLAMGMSICKCECPIIINEKTPTDFSGAKLTPIKSSDGSSRSRVKVTFWILSWEGNLFLAEERLLGHILFSATEVNEIQQRGGSWDVGFCF